MDQYGFMLRCNRIKQADKKPVTEIINASLPFKTVIHSLSLQNLTIILIAFVVFRQPLNILSYSLNKEAHYV